MPSNGVVNHHALTRLTGLLGQQQMDGRQQALSLSSFAHESPPAACVWQQQEAGGSLHGLLLLLTHQPAAAHAPAACSAPPTPYRGERLAAEASQPPSPHLHSPPDCCALEYSDVS